MAAAHETFERVSEGGSDGDALREPRARTSSQTPRESWSTRHRRRCAKWYGATVDTSRRSVQVVRDRPRRTTRKERRQHYGRGLNSLVKGGEACDHHRSASFGISSYRSRTSKTLEEPARLPGTPVAIGGAGGLFSFDAVSSSRQSRRYARDRFRL